MRVLSLFDGISCARVALDKLGVPVEHYYASEIDPYAIEISKARWKNKVEHIGNVEMLRGGVLQGYRFAHRWLAVPRPKHCKIWQAGACRCTLWFVLRVCAVTARSKAKVFYIGKCG